MNVCCLKPQSLWSYVTTGAVICLTQDFCGLVLTSGSCDPQGCPDLLWVRRGVWRPPALSPASLSIRIIPGTRARRLPSLLARPRPCCAPLLPLRPSGRPEVVGRLRWPRRVRPSERRSPRLRDPACCGDRVRRYSDGGQSFSALPAVSQQNWDLNPWLPDLGACGLSLK